MDANRGTVYVIDDDAGVRHGLTDLLRSAGWDVEAYAAAGEFLDSVDSDGIGCIVLDVSMPGMTGPELHDELRRRGRTLPIVYLSGRGTLSIGVEAMRQGAYDFLEKPVDEAALLSVVEAAVARRQHAYVQENHLNDIRQRLGRLSPREREVMDNVIRGRLNKQIASDLAIGVKTVKVHRSRAMSKMGVRSVAELVHLCDAIGLGERSESESA